MSAERSRRRAASGTTRGGSGERATSTATYAAIGAAIIAAIASVGASIITVRQATVLQKSQKVLEFHKDRIDKFNAILNTFCPTRYVFPSRDWRMHFDVVAIKFKECYEVYEKVAYLINEPYRGTLERDHETIEEANTKWYGIIIGIS